MDKWIPEYNKRLVRKHRFGFSPSYKVSINSCLKPAASIHLAVKIVDMLDWELEYSDHQTVIAVRINSFGTKTQRIIINASAAFLEIESKSLNDGFWDMGNNSKRVQYFVFAYQEEECKLDRKQITEIENKVRQEEKWANYKIPETLPPPPVKSETRPLSFISSCLFIAVATGLVFAFLLSKNIYIILLMEALTGLLMGYVTGFFSGVFQFTESGSLKKMFLFTVVLFFLSNLYFQFVFISANKPLLSLGFFEYLQMRLESGLQLGKANTGWIGVVISWVLQLIIPYYIGILRLAKSNLEYRMQRVPQEVIDFTYYHFLNGKTENAVRKELSKMGWRKKENQDDVLSALHALFEYQELTKSLLKN